MVGGPGSPRETGQEIRPRRGEVYFVDFDPAFGAEIGKTRPAVILQSDVWNRTSPVTIVAAVTSKGGTRRYSTDVSISTREGGLWMDSRVLLNQIRTVDKRRLGRRLGFVSPTTMARVDRALRASLGLLRA